MIASYFTMLTLFGEKIKARQEQTYKTLVFNFEVRYLNAHENLLAEPWRLGLQSVIEPNKSIEFETL